MANISVGIVGLPNVGKSTLFNALTKKGVLAENYPFCTIDPSVGIIAVPDLRLDKLYEFSGKSGKKIPAVVEFVDIAGLVQGAAEGEGLGNKFLSHIREVDAIAHVVRIFEDKEILHVAGKMDPLFDIEIINLELEKADLHKPILYVVNTSEASENRRDILDKIPGPYVEVDPIFEKGLEDLIKKAYETLDLITYFTTGEDETRGWTVKRNCTAPEAGRAIHNDFKDKFIRAEVIEWNKLLEAGSYGAAREKGWLRTEGKEYIVQDGDVIEFKI